MSEAVKKSPMDRVTDFAMKIAEPLEKVASLPEIMAIQNGLVAVMPVIIIGSLFLVLQIFGDGSIEGVVVPFLAPIASQLAVVNQLTMSFLSVYAAVTIAACYGEELGVDTKTCSLLGLVIFFTFTLDGVTDSMIPTTAFSATGLFAVMVSSLVGIRLYKFLIDRNITIKMPDSVPPAVGSAFTSLIPFAAVVTVCWLIRTVLAFDMVDFLTNVLTPLVTAADNIVVYTIERFVSALLWAVGLHGDNMWTTPVFVPFEIIWTEENAAAAAAGETLQHIWTYSGIDRITTWPALAWPIVILMVRSKVDYLRKLGWACLPAACFTIVEPVIFGLPLALNPFLIVPYLIIALITPIISYGAFALGLVSKFFASLPWATPVFLLGPLGTGDIMTIALIALVFVIGLVIYIPFWRVYENHLLEEERQKAEAQAQAQAAQGAEVAALES